MEDGGEGNQLSWRRHYRWIMDSTLNRPRLHTSTNSMDQNTSWKFNGRSSREEFPHLLWNSKVQYSEYSVRNSPSLVLILSQRNPIHNVTPYFFNIPFHIIFQFTPRSPNWPIPFSFSKTNLYTFLIVLPVLPIPLSLIWSP